MFRSLIEPYLFPCNSNHTYSDSRNFCVVVHDEGLTIDKRDIQPSSRNLCGRLHRYTYGISPALCNIETGTMTHNIDDDSGDDDDDNDDDDDDDYDDGDDDDDDGDSDDDDDDYDDGDGEDDVGNDDDDDDDDNYDNDSGYNYRYGRYSNLIKRNMAPAFYLGCIMIQVLKKIKISLYCSTF
ncbi:hypothetical protein ElyMa_002494500 [Elysia marginata]|uniref:Uncharacterized protein n=1 Tax=Elysia marginata TaxID=1093978 RepID=A0AAV4GR31_9GAST|nr:hypothetical protein ElyMa_002494500 [Elysia marginata]